MSIYFQPCGVLSPQTQPFVPCPATLSFIAEMSCHQTPPQSEAETHWASKAERISLLYFIFHKSWSVAFISQQATMKYVPWGTTCSIFLPPSSTSAKLLLKPQRAEPGSRRCVSCIKRPPLDIWASSVWSEGFMQTHRQHQQSTHSLFRKESVLLFVASGVCPTRRERSRGTQQGKRSARH